MLLLRLFVGFSADICIFVGLRQRTTEIIYACRIAFSCYSCFIWYLFYLTKISSINKMDNTYISTNLEWIIIIYWALTYFDMMEIWKDKDENFDEINSLDISGKIV